MTWLTSRSVSAEVEQKLEKRINEYLANDSSHNGGMDGGAAKELVIELYLIIEGNADPEQEELLREQITKMAAEWDSDDTQLAHIQKYLNRLFSVREQSASDYIDRAVNQQIASTTAIVHSAKKSAATHSANSKHEKNNAAKNAALAYYEKNKANYSSKKNAARDLESKFPPLKYSTYYRLLKKG
jgi:hypothetical protein